MFCYNSLLFSYPRGHRFPEDTTTPRRPSRSEQLLYTIPPDGLIVVELDANSDEFESVEFKVRTNLDFFLRLFFTLTFVVAVESGLVTRS